MVSVDLLSEKRSHGVSAGAEEQNLAPQSETLTRKVDWHLLPILTLLYLLSFLDRSNVGNASVDGLSTKINLVGGEYNAGLALYFVGYVLFEIPANIVLKRTSPNIWLPSLTLTWGIVSICQGLVHNKAGFYAVRFFLGATEAGLFPGVTYVFSLYYTREQRSIRVAFFFSGAALAGAFGGILAYGLGLIQGGGRPGWAWIFIVEGLLTAVVSLGAYFIVPTWPQKASFLDESEREQLLTRLRRDADGGDIEPFNWRGVRQALSDPLVYLYALLFHGSAFTLYSISLFLPTIIKNLGFATWKLLTTPPYALAFLVTMSIVWASIGVRRKAPFILGSSALAIVGYIILITTSKAGPQYFGTFVTVSGVYTANAMILSWPGENVSAQTKRAIALAMQISLGDLDYLPTGVLVYRPNLSAHNYRTPHIVALGYTVLTALATLALWTLMSRQNMRRDEARVELSGDSEDKAVIRRRELGDRHPAWRYRL
ncbi:MFS general substrate transporter [Ramaria rubella]|nr:MFS general substrate transporter [Ramaria rubella]